MVSAPLPAGRASKPATARSGVHPLGEWCASVAVRSVCENIASRKEIVSGLAAARGRGELRLNSAGDLRGVRLGVAIIVPRTQLEVSHRGAALWPDHPSRVNDACVLAAPRDCSWLCALHEPPRLASLAAACWLHVRFEVILSRSAGRVRREHPMGRIVALPLEPLLLL